MRRLRHYETVDPDGHFGVPSVWRLTDGLTVADQLDGKWTPTEHAGIMERKVIEAHDGSDVELARKLNRRAA